MLIPNNPDIDFAELNRRIAAEMQRLQQVSDKPALPTFAAAPAGNEYPLPSTWQDVLPQEDDALVRSAYLYLLGRTVDEPSLRHWTNELRNGADKFEFLASVRYSAEGQQHNAHAPGLRRARIKNRLRSIPVIGRLLLSAYGCMNTETRHRGYMARLHHLYLQQNVQSQSLGGLQRTVHEQMPKQLHSLQQKQQSQDEQINRLASELHQAYQANQELRARLSHLESLPSSTRPAGIPSTAQENQSNAIPESFYLAFENRFRGDETTLRERMAYYLPLLDKIPPLQSGLPLADIGCGRGEWLQMLPSGCQRIGIDLNAMNVQACHERGLHAEQADALHWLASQADNSIAAISAFHVIEHLSFEQLNTLLDQCRRVLAPGGMLIFETPNPENLITAATHFHTDPTHLHPLPPAFTEFFVEFKGFNEVTIHRLNPIPREYALDEDSEVARRCDALFYGPQDYAVTARK